MCHKNNLCGTSNDFFIGDYVYPVPFIGASRRNRKENRRRSTWAHARRKRAVGGARARTWASRRDLSVRPSKRILSRASEELLRGREMEGGGGQRVGSDDRGVSAPALRCRDSRRKKAKRRRGDAGGCSPDELAKEDLLVGVEGLWSSRGDRGERCQRMGRDGSFPKMARRRLLSRDRAPKSPSASVPENARR